MPILLSDIFIKYTKQFSLLINMYNVELKPDEISLGEEMEVLVIKGKGDSIISRMKDGRVILFNRENRYSLNSDLA